MAAIEGMLKEAHDLFVMFFGSIRGMLQKHPVGDLARSCLHAFFPDYLAGKVHLLFMRAVDRNFVSIRNWLSYVRRIVII